MMPNIIDFLREKYGNYWGERFQTVEAFKEWLDKDYFIEKIWNIEEYPYITLVQISDNHNLTWNELVVIEGVHKEKEFK